MKWIFVALIFSFPVSMSYASTVDDFSPHTLVKRVSNEQQVIPRMKQMTSRSFHPTRVIRVAGDIAGLNIDCKQVQTTVDELIFSQIPARHFLYNTLNLCTYDPDTRLATHFVIDSYIDPITDQDDALLQAIEKRLDGADIFGIPVKIEHAKGVVVSLAMNAGREDRKGDPRIIRFRRDHKSLYFDSNFDLTLHLIADIRQRFFSPDRDKILPFIGTWFYQGMTHAYESLLQHVNLMELLPERIFIMQSGDPIFASRMHMYYSHHCQKYDSGVCLKQTD